MKFRPVPDQQRPLPVRVALWLLDASPLGHTAGGKRLAGHLLKQPAMQGVVLAQRRLGQLLCCESADLRDRRMGQELLRQAARAGDQRARQALGGLNEQLRLKQRPLPR